MSGNECINQEKLRTNKHSVHCNTNYPLETLSTDPGATPLYPHLPGNISINMYIFAVNYQF